VAEESRRYERIDIALPCRLFIPGAGRGLRFEAFTRTRNLGLGGVFTEASFLMKEGIEVHAELGLPTGPLVIRSRVSYSLNHAQRDWPTGMGLEFLDVDARGRETLLRYFTPSRYRAFQQELVGEFPHLEADLPLEDVSLVLNLWEEFKVRHVEDAPAALPSGRRPARPKR
jgi:hypothetical protein